MIRTEIVKPFSVSNCCGWLAVFVVPTTGWSGRTLPIDPIRYQSVQHLTIFFIVESLDALIPKQALPARIDERSP